MIYSYDDLIFWMAVLIDLYAFTREREKKKMCYWFVSVNIEYLSALTLRSVCRWMVVLSQRCMNHSMCVNVIPKFSKLIECVRRRTDLLFVSWFKGFLFMIILTLWIFLVPRMWKIQCDGNDVTHDVENQRNQSHFSWLLTRNCITYDEHESDDVHIRILRKKDRNSSKSI